ncbi:MAG: 6,7-dimethyl-8-ribityllumazine synthase [Gammaproteobacteria bacterium]|jgi:6,7-dimethyl-8-ribityllumazine synthase
MAKYDIEEGQYSVRGCRFAIVAAKFNGAIVDKLVDGALDTLARHQVGAEAIDVIRVPGAFELALAAQRVAQSNKVDAILTLGAVIRGGTPHFEYVCTEAARGAMNVGLEQNIPVIFGVLTTDDLEQALERAGGAEGNKGAEAAIAALEMVSLLRELGS